MFRRLLFCLMCICVAVVGAKVPAAHATESGITFDPPTSYEVGAQPRAIAAGDVDLDGKMDLFLACDGGGGVSVLRGMGGGTFQPKVDYPTGTSPFSIVMAEIDGDAWPDLVVANATSGTVVLLRGNGSGGFQAKVDIATGVVPELVMTGDLNHDGKVDVVFANYGSGTVSVLLGNGAGGFAPKIDYEGGGAARAGALADLSGDGFLDILVANGGGSTISIFLGTGTGTFAARTDYPVGANPEAVTVGRFNSDTLLDVAVANFGSNSVSVLLGSGAGALAPRLDYSVGASPWSVVSADLDLDGFVDLAIANYGSSSISLLRGIGGGGFETLEPQLSGFSNPISLTSVDLDGDGAPDLASADISASVARVLLNKSVPPGESTAVSLSSSADTTTYGQAFTLIATVQPAQAGGMIEFRSDGVIVGASSVDSGTATIQLSGLTYGAHEITARRLATLGWAGNVSQPHIHFVRRAPTRIELSASVSPSAQRERVQFIATCSALPPSSAQAEGAVQFSIDGIECGSSRVLQGGVAASPTIDSLVPGVHTVSATFVPSDTLRFEPSASTSFEHVVQPSNPEIVRIRDIPFDQGGRVSLSWHCVLDKPGVRIITGYRIWRRLPHTSSLVGGGSGKSSILATTDSSGAETFWEAIAELPAAQLVSYGYTAATTRDSMAGSNPCTAFFVQSLTSDPFVSYVSVPDSGYSVDNLSPPAPSPFVARYDGTDIALHWLPSRAADFAEFRLHRGGSINFVPGPSNMIFAGRDTGLVDRAGLGGFYKLAAVDVHGNVGRFAMVSPTNPTATLASFVSSDWTGSAASLVWYGAGLTALRVNVYRSDDGASWNMLGQVAADDEGFVRFSDATVMPRHRYSYKLGILDEDTEQFVGMTTIEIPGGHLAIRSVVGNPVRGEAIHFVASLAGTSPARARVLDLAGRVVREQNVQADLSGQLSLSLSGGERLRPGVYLLEVQQAGERAVTRFVYLR